MYPIFSKVCFYFLPQVHAMGHSSLAELTRANEEGPTTCRVKRIASAAEIIDHPSPNPSMDELFSLMRLWLLLGPKQDPLWEPRLLKDSAKLDERLT